MATETRTYINPQDRWWSCQRKSKFGDQERAERAARCKSEQTSDSYHAYECDWCGGWHVGRPMTQRDKRDHAA